MKLSLSWLRKYIDVPEDAHTLAELLTFAGIEVEDIQNLNAMPETVVTARVVSAEKVPDTDHLQLCRIDLGEYPHPEKDADGLLQVICGAPNCHSGMMAVIALPGTALGDLQIKKAKIRGVVSNGMLCSERELGLSENHAGIIELPPDTVPGVSVNKILELPDVVYELEITPNRSDLLGYIGIARDLSAKLDRELILPNDPDLQPSGSELKLGLTNLEPELCPRYTARVIKGVKVVESPDWLKNALVKNGLRPINNIVDITNYVLLETGHPLHAFDYDKLASKDKNQGYPDIIVRKAFPQESFLALDGKTYTLDGDELVIADGEKASALAGIMGGEHSAITGQTTNIVLESAAFHPGSIRKTSYKHKITSDSSYRFERHLSPLYADRISRRATEMILELAGGELCGDIHDDYPQSQPEYILGIRPDKFAALIGYSLSGDEIKTYLTRLGFTFLQYGNFIPGKIMDINEVFCHHAEEMKRGVTEFTELDDCQHSLYFRVPGYRVDVFREADIIEELARLAGYDKVPAPAPASLIMDRHAYRVQRLMTDWVVSCGCYETLNYSFTDPDQMKLLGYVPEQLNLVTLVNPQSSNQSVMRSSLIPQLLTNLAYNLNHGERDVMLFEMAKVYLKSIAGITEPLRMVAVFSGKINEEHWQDKPRMVNFSWVKGCYETLLQDLGLPYQQESAKLPYLVSGDSLQYVSGDRSLGYFGRVNPRVLAAWGIDTTALKQDVWVLEYAVDQVVETTRNKVVQYVNIPKYPAVTRDLSFLCPTSIMYQDLQRSIPELDRSLIREISVFDEYRSDNIPQGYRSLSLHIILQDQEKTLTEQRIDDLMQKIVKYLENQYQIRMR